MNITIMINKEEDHQHKSALIAPRGVHEHHNHE